MIAARVRLEQQAGLFRAEVSAELFAHALMGIIERFVRQAPGRNPRRCRDSSRTCCWTAPVAARAGGHARLTLRQH